jgi:hypothetical protein
MSQNASLVMTDRVDTLRSRLDDPEVSEALGTILDHADLLALIVSGLDGFLSRGDVITDSLGEGIGELRAGGGTLPDPAELGKLVTSLGSLTGTLGEAGPLLERVVGSDVTSQAAIDVVSLAARALVEGHATAQANQARVQGVRALLRLLKDDDLARGLGFVVEVGRALGRELDRERTARPGT